MLLALVVCRCARNGPDYVGPRQRDVLHAGLRDAVTLPLADRWGLDAKEDGYRLRPAESFDDRFCVHGGDYRHTYFRRAIGKPMPGLGRLP